ncbi:MAG: hypothetical protein H6729_12710 [Deltaproteobacteria bacterium]|nr:hypothetical protein [Deltaproteobacteria bacterium]
MILGYALGSLSALFVLGAPEQADRSIPDAAVADDRPESQAGGHQAREGVGTQDGGPGRLGLGLYAASLGVLVLSGGAALLRLRVEELPSLVLLAGGVAAIWAAGPVLRAPAVLVGVALAAIVHAGFAAARRSPSPARIRVLLATLLMVGAAGAAFALGAGVLPVALGVALGHEG